MSLLFKYYSLVEVIYLLIRFKRFSPSYGTQSILTEMVQMSKTHIPQIARER